MNINESSDQMMQDVKKTARDSVNAAKTVAKSAGKIATGNYVGAAFEILKNPKLIIIVISFILIFNMILFYAAPIAIFETVNSVAEDLESFWDTVREDFYSGGGGVVDRTLFTIGSFFSRTFSTATGALAELWNSSKTQQTENDLGKDLDSLSDADMGVLGSEESAIEVYQRKVDAVKDKILSRAEYVKSAIEDSCYSDVTNTGTINGWVYNNLFVAKDATIYQTYSQDWWAQGNNYSAGIAVEDDVVEVVYGGVTPVISSPAVKTRNAVDIIGLYTAMHNTSIDNVKVYELMKWMGYNRGWDNDHFIVGDVISIPVKAWKGTFMPMYLETEKATLMHSNNLIKFFGSDSNGKTVKADLSVFDDCQMAASDLLISLSSTSLYSLAPVVTLETFMHYEKVSDAYTTSYQYSTQTTVQKSYHYYDFPAKFENNRSVKGTKGLDYKILIDEEGREYRKPLRDNAVKEWIAGMNKINGTQIVTEMHTATQVHEAEFGYVQRNRAIITYPFSASVGVRNISAIEKLAGFVNQPQDNPSPSEEQPDNALPVDEEVVQVA